jgi:hypothetical protein
MLIDSAMNHTHEALEEVPYNNESLKVRENRSETGCRNKNYITNIDTRLIKLRAFFINELFSKRFIRKIHSQTDKAS